MDLSSNLQVLPLDTLAVQILNPSQLLLKRSKAVPKAVAQNPF